MAHNHLADPDSELAPLLALIPNYEDTTTPLSTLREQFNTDDALEIKDHKVPSGDDEISVRVYVPRAAELDATFPVLVWNHGGGFTFGNLETDDYYLRIISAELKLAIVSVDYRLAPENPYPIGLNDTYAALKWVARNPALARADFKKGFLVGGQSSGGNYAAVLAHRAKADPKFSEAKLTGQLLQMPVGLLHPEAVPPELIPKLNSYEQNKNAPMLTRKQMLDFLGNLKPDPKNPEVFPLLYPSFEGLPPAYIQVCGLDPNRDEELLYAEKLQAAGVPTKVDTYPGAPHAFHLIFATTAAAQKLEKDFREGIKFLLNVGASS
ncbi:Alpha/Beta hydrolase protein [Trametes maxima]|nr:Alpha/Beta hydrolase protein [Trametes maxima]